MSNGELVAVATQAGFTCILTQDRLFAESAARTLQKASAISLVVVRLPQRPWREYLQQFRDAWAKHPIEPAPGKVVSWPVGEH